MTETPRKITNISQNKLRSFAKNRAILQQYITLTYIIAYTKVYFDEFIEICQNK